MSAAAQISWDEQPQQAAPQVSWDEEKPQKKSFFQKVRDVMPEGLIRRGLEAGSEWAGRKQEESYNEDLKAAARGEAPRAMPGYSPGSGYGMLSSAMRFGASAVQPTPKEAAAGAAVIAPEIAGPVMVGHGLWNAAKNAPAAVKGNPEAAEATLLSGAEAAGGGAVEGAAIEGGLRNTGTGRMLSAAKRMIGREISPEGAVTPRPAGQFQPALASAPREVLEHAAKEGIDLTPAQATEVPIARSLQAAGERGLVSGKSLNQALEASRTKFGRAVNNFAERLDPKRMGLSEEQAGESIQQAARVGKDVAHENAANGYKNIDYLMQEKVEPSPISGKWMELRESLPMGVEEQIRAQVPRDLRAMVEDMLSAKPEGFHPTFEQGIKLRSFFRELGETDGLPDSQQAAFRQLSKAADSAMESTAKKVGSEKEWRDANAGWKDYATKYGDKQSPLYRILRQADPAKITRDLMNRASARDIEILKAEGMDSALEPLRRQVIQDISRNKFTVGRDGLGGYQHSFLNTLFGPDGVKELYLKADIARRIGWEVNPSGTSNVMLAAEQLGKPSRIAELMGAAKLSMPRPAAEYLPRGTTPPFRVSPRLLRAAATATAGQNAGEQ